MLSDQQIANTCEKIAEEQPIEQKADGLEWVMDKILPYLVVYTYKTSIDDAVAALVRTQACYLISKEDYDYKDLIKCTSSAVSSIYNAFLVIEITPCNDDRLAVCWSKGQLGPVLNTLERNLADFDFGNHHLNLDIRHFDSRKEDPEVESNEVNWLEILLPKWFTYTDGKMNYPLLFRAFQTHFNECLKKAAFEFMRVHTSHPFTTHLMLGTARIDQSAKVADRLLSQLHSSLNFLMNVSPVNERQAWKQFCENNFEVKPRFTYRTLPFDPDLIKRQLFDLKLEKVRNPTLAYLLHEKRLEFEQKLTLLGAREKESFKHISQSLFPPPSPELVKVAKEVLELVQADYKASEAMDSAAFHQLAIGEIDAYKQKFKQIPLKCEVRDDIIGLMVDGPTLYVGTSLSIPADRAEALLQHEVGTHLLTYCNGMQQPLTLMFSGLAGYDELQEGLAVFSEYLVGGLNGNRMRLLAARVMAVHHMVQGDSFCDTFHKLQYDYGCTQSVSWKVTVRVYRGGGLTKDAVYLKGLIDLLDFIKTTEDISLLFTGKFNTHHIQVMKELYQQGTLKKPVMPNHHEDNDYQTRLNAAQDSAFKLYDLIEKR